MNKICLKGTDTIQLLPASISSVVEKNWGRNWKLVRTAIERREREVVTREQRETCTGVGWKVAYCLFENQLNSELKKSQQGVIHLEMYTQVVMRNCGI